MSDADDVATVNDANTMFVHCEEMIEDNNHEKKEKEKRMRIEKKDCKHLDKDECEQYHHSGCYWTMSENMCVIDGADELKLISYSLVDSDISDEFDEGDNGSSSKSSKHHRHRVRHRKRVRQRKRQRHRHRVRSRKRSRQRHRHKKEREVEREDNENVTIVSRLVNIVHLTLNAVKVKMFVPPLYFRGTMEYPICVPRYQVNDFVVDMVESLSFIKAFECSSKDKGSIIVPKEAHLTRKRNIY